MAKVHVLWATQGNGYNNKTIVLQVFSEGGAAEAAKAVIDSCEPRFVVEITEVEFIGTVAAHGQQSVKADPYLRGVSIPPLAGLPQNGSLIGDPPPSPGESLSDLAEKIHEMSEA